MALYMSEGHFVLLSFYLGYFYTNPTVLRLTINHSGTNIFIIQ